MADVKTDPNSATIAMLREIKKMEERLSEKITTSKDQEITELEERLNNNIRTTIDTSIKDALRVLQTSLNSSVENNPIINSHSVQLKDLQDENSRLNRKVQQLTAEQGRMKQQLNKMENMALENSLIIRGLPEVFKETEPMIIDKLHRILSKIMQGDTDEQKLANAKQITIKNCCWLGRPTKQRIRPVSIELYHKQDVEFILENRFDLDRGIYIDREYPMDVERKRKTLLPILRAAKRSSEYKKQSRLEDDKIVLKGRQYDVNTLNQLPEELNVFKVTTRENAETIGYFGEINPLSNFYPATFTHDGVQYISSEQFIQANKAKYFWDHEAYNQIMGCSTSLECKRASRQIRNVDANKWDMVAGDLCQPGIQYKFLQNPPVMDTLLWKTGQKTIVECTSDRLWGTGIPLNDPDCLNSSKWINQGIMGQILEGIRNNVLQSQPHPYSWSVSLNPPQFAVNNYQHLTAQNTGRANANVVVSMANIPHSTSDPAPDNSRQPLSRQSIEHSITTTDSESTSTTLVSDTTTSDVEIGEPNTKQLETEVSLMEEGTPVQECLQNK